MRYENRQPTDETINVSKVSPLAQFAKLVIAAAIFVVLLVLVLQFFGGALAKRVPFKYELQLMERIDMDFTEADASGEMTKYLNELAGRLELLLPLEPEIEVKVHYNDESVFNAFATIGGNLFFYRGLLSKMPNENALAMVMAHEMAHVNHRDPITSFGGGVASMVALTMVTGETGFAGKFLTQAGVLTGTQFTRRMETQADTAALGAVNQLYGHVAGADTLFEVMGEIKSDSDAVPDWLERFAATHPLSSDRVTAVFDLAEKNGWSASGELTPLPASFHQWLEE